MGGEGEFSKPKQREKRNSRPDRLCSINNVIHVYIIWKNLNSKTKKVNKS